jgi:hypothetical protein
MRNKGSNFSPDEMSIWDEGQSLILYKELYITEYKEAGGGCVFTGIINKKRDEFFHITLTYN